MMSGPEKDRPEPYVSSRPAEADGPDPQSWAGSPREPGPLGAAAGDASASTGPEWLAGVMGEEPSQPGSSDEVAALRAELATAQEQLAASREQYLRAMAEAENIRRRSQEEVLKARKFANEAFAESLLPVIDSLELALKTETPTLESIREGVEATLRLMISAFDKHRLVGIDPTGEKFDPNHHQAISMVPGDATSPPTPANHVATVLQKGYLINDRVLRPALVTVVQG